MGCGDESLSGGSPVLECWALKLGEQVNDARADNVQRRASEKFLGINNYGWARFRTEDGSTDTHHGNYIRDVLDAAEREGYNMPHYQLAQMRLREWQRTQKLCSVFGNVASLGIVAVGLLACSVAIFKTGNMISDRIINESRQKAVPLAAPSPYRVNVEKGLVFRDETEGKFTSWSFSPSGGCEVCTHTPLSNSEKSGVLAILDDVIDGKYQSKCQPAEATSGFSDAFAAYYTEKSGGAITPEAAKAAAQGYVNYRKIILASPAAK